MFSESRKDASSTARVTGFDGTRNEIRAAAADFALRRIPELHRAGIA